MEKHISTEKKQLGLKLGQLYRSVGRKSVLSINSRLLVYKVILKLAWTDGIPFCGIAFRSNFMILGRFHSKVVRAIVNAALFVSYYIIIRDLPIKLFIKKKENTSQTIQKG